MTEDKNKLVLINDEATALKALARILGREYEVRTFLDPIEAWKFLEGRPEVDVVMCDLYMPRLDGISLARYLKTSSVPGVSDIPVVLSSTVAGGEDMEELAVQTGAAGFIGLPMRPGELLANLKDIVSGDFSGDQMDLAFLTSDQASPLVGALKSLLPAENCRFRVLQGEQDAQSLIDVEFVVLSDDLDAVEELLTKLSHPGRAYVLVVFSLSRSSDRVQRLMEFGADAVINSAVSSDEFQKTLRLCARQRALYRIMERRAHDHYSVV